MEKISCCESNRTKVQISSTYTKAEHATLVLVEGKRLVEFRSLMAR